MSGGRIKPDLLYCWVVWGVGGWGGITRFETTWLPAPRGHHFYLYRRLIQAAAEETTAVAVEVANQAAIMEASRVAAIEALEVWKGVGAEIAAEFTAALAPQTNATMF